MRKLRRDSKALGLRFKELAKVKGIEFDSRKVKPGFVFVAVRGVSNDGHDFIPEVIKIGVKVIIGEKKIRVPRSISYIEVKDSKQTLGELASEFYGFPSRKLITIGVTGTKGKTTTCHLIYHILTSLGKKAGLISSIMAKIGEKEIDTGFHVTSPDVVTLHRMLKEMVDAGCEYAVVEVSSHGIDQGRIAGVKFDVGVLTNIAPEHLDYHKTFAEYKRLKFSFIDSAKVKIISRADTDLDILPGKFNNLNAQTAVDVVASFGFDKEKATDALHSFKLPEGRLEEIKNGLGFRVFVDFAHTPDSLRLVLEYLMTITPGRLIAVFGCAGERDPRKRFRMGKISGKIADLSVFTAEDPRSENLYAILNKMAEGAKGGNQYFKIPERGEAIALALSFAKKDDCVVVCGKGHEKSMAYKGSEHPWSDRKVIKECLTADKSIAAVVLAAGKGKRMHSSLPKVLHEICGRPMISYALENLRKAKVGEIIVVVGYRKNEVIKKVGGAVKIAVQKNPVGGTADAAKAGFEKVSESAKTLVIINGDDSAFYTPETIKKVIDQHKKEKSMITFVSLIKENPFGLGRVIRDKNSSVLAIVEEKDATEGQRKTKEINDGLYVFEKDWFEKNIKKVKKSLQGEYYLVDLVKIAIDQKDKLVTFVLPNDNEWQGINTPEQLAEANEKMKWKLQN